MSRISQPTAHRRRHHSHGLRRPLVALGLLVLLSTASLTNAWAADFVSASAGGPYVGRVNQAVTLDASGSFDTDSTVTLSFAWDVQNNGLFEDGVGPRISHTWTAPGTYGVAVRVSDGRGYSVVAYSSVAVGAYAQTIRFAPIAEQVFGGAPFTVNATGGPGDKPLILQAGWPYTVCTPGPTTTGIDGLGRPTASALMTIVGAGTCTIAASQEASTDLVYAAGHASVDVVVDKAAQTLTFTNGPPAAPTYGGSWTPTYTGGSSPSVPVLGLTATSTGCHLDAGTVSFTGTGSCVVTLDQAGDTNYLAAPQIQQPITLSPAGLTAQITGSQLYGGIPQFSVTALAGLLPADPSSTVTGTLTGCTTTATTASHVGSITGSITGCTGLTAGANYTISYADSGFTITTAPLTVHASSPSATYGTTPPVTPAYTGFLNGDGPATVNPQPTCSTTATTGSPVGSYPTSCTGGAAGDYTLNYLPGTATITAAATSLTSTTALSAAAGAGLTPSATLASTAGPCQTGQPVTFSLDKNPLTGTTGSYLLGSGTSNSTGAATASAVSTSGWQPTAYTLTATYPGNGNCSGSTTTAPLTVTAPGQAAAGAGTYTIPGAGTVTVGFAVTRYPLATGTTYIGGISLVQTGKWSFQGNVTSYLKPSATQGTIAGTGTLSWWNATLNHNHGGWAIARTGVPYTANFSASTRTVAGAFGAYLTYTPTSPQPLVLPNSNPIPLTQGAISMG